jgi:beta-glucosidase
MEAVSRSQFPEDFRWGAATSAYQIEGAVAEDGRKPSIWDTFSEQPGNTFNNDTGRTACDHYHRWREDLDLVQAMGFNAYRFSVSWPRVLPDGRGAVNARGLDFYDRLVDGLLERGIDPWLTLFHWDLPQALQDAGGWPNRDTVDAFANYADVVSARLGDRVKHWATHNEPWCSSIIGYFNGDFAPGERDLGRAMQACHHVLLSHGQALPVLRANVPNAKCGIVLSLHPIHPARDRAEDHVAVRRHDGLRNRWFLDALHGRGYPKDVVDALGPAAPRVLDGDLAVIAGKTDYLGINYYFREVVADDPDSTGPTRTQVVELDGVDKTDFDWEIYPQGLVELLTRVQRDYAPGPIAITENGAFFADVVGPEGQINDIERLSFIRRHIEAVKVARAAGVDVMGYFAWSLLDNFEWASGYDKRFGLVHVDFATQRRTVKTSGKWFAQFLRDGRT